jgi:threonine/homoserine/homoserine lactone efflux protein
LIAAFVIAFVFSFLGSMPIAGPIAVIVLSRGLDNKPRSGFFIALGAALVESIYAGLAFLGLTAMLARYPLLVPISRLAGCLILVGLGIAFIVRRQKPDAPASQPESKQDATTSLGSAFIGISVTAVNPTLLVTWTAAVSAAQSTGFLRVAPIDAIPFGVGVAGGIVTWFATLLWLLVKFRRKVGPTSVDKLVRGMGVILLVAGIGLGIRTVLRWHAGM